jgi:hypothetical protein
LRKKNKQRYIWAKAEEKERLLFFFIFSVAVETLKSVHGLSTTINTTTQLCKQKNCIKRQGIMKLKMIVFRLKTPLRGERVKVKKKII